MGANAAKAAGPATLTRSNLGNQDRLFCPDKFAAIQEQLGIKFTLDACCNPDGNNKLVDKYCSTSNDFLKYPPLPDEVMWINAPFNSLQEFISRYTDLNLRLKSVNPGLSMPRTLSRNMQK